MFEIRLVVFTLQIFRENEKSICVFFLGRSLIVKKNDGIKESTDSQATIDDEDTRGRCQKG